VAIRYGAAVDFSTWGDPRNVVALAAIFSSAAVAITVLVLGAKQRRGELGLTLRRAAHLRLWTAASAWQRDLDLVVRTTHEDERRLLDAIDESDMERQAWDAVWEVEIVSPAMYKMCHSIVGTLSQANASAREAVHAEFEHSDSNKHWEATKSHVDSVAKQLTALRDEFRMVGQYIEARGWWRP
jgi:hypothetical protein